MLTPWPSTVIWKRYGFWALWVGVAFFSIYPTCNWISSLRETTYHWYFYQETLIPFVPEFIWFYLSMYVLFLAPPFFLQRHQLTALGQQLVVATVIAGVVFLLFPTELGFERILPESEYYAQFYHNLFALDHPHNMVPSLHVVFSAIIILSLLDVSTRRTVRVAWWLWLCLIMASTVLVHQHHLLDVVSGLALAAGVRFYIGRRSRDIQVD